MVLPLGFEPRSSPHLEASPGYKPGALTVKLWEQKLFGPGFYLEENQEKLYSHRRTVSVPETYLATFCFDTLDHVFEQDRSKVWCLLNTDTVITRIVFV